MHKSADVVIPHLGINSAKSNPLQCVANKRDSAVKYNPPTSISPAFPNHDLCGFYSSAIRCLQIVMASCKHWLQLLMTREPFKTSLYTCYSIKFYILQHFYHPPGVYKCFKYVHFVLVLSSVHNFTSRICSHMNGALVLVASPHTADSCPVKQSLISLRVWGIQEKPFCPEVD